MWEWTWDYDGEYASGSSIDPTGPSNGSARVFRGCSWYDDARLCRAASRHRRVPKHSRITLGFRVARTLHD